MFVCYVPVYARALTNVFNIGCILVPRGRDPCVQRHGSRPLAGNEAGSPRSTDFWLLCAAVEIWNNNGYHRLPKWAAIALARYLAPARGLNPWRRPKGSWALGTRMYWMDIVWNKTLRSLKELVKLLPVMFTIQPSNLHFLRIRNFQIVEKLFQKSQLPTQTFDLKLR